AQLHREAPAPEQFARDERGPAARERLVDLLRVVVPDRAPHRLDRLLRAVVGGLAVVGGCSAAPRRRCHANVLQAATRPAPISTSIAHPPGDGFASPPLFTRRRYFSPTPTSTCDGLPCPPSSPVSALNS